MNDRGIPQALIARQHEASDPEVSALLSDSDIEERFDLDYHFKHIDTIFSRVFG